MSKKRYLCLLALRAIVLLRDVSVYTVVFTITWGLWILQRCSDFIIFLGTCLRESIDSVTITFSMGQENNLNKSDYTIVKCMELSNKILDSVYGKPTIKENKIINGKVSMLNNTSFALVND